MDTGGTTFFESGVWIIPIILLAIVGSLFVLVYFWKNRTRQDMKLLRREMRRLQAGRRQLNLVGEAYAADDPEPFGSKFQTLQKQLDDIDRQVTELELTHVAIQEEAHRLSSKQWQVMLVSPYYWYVLRMDIVAFHKDIQSVQATLASLDDDFQSIARIGWEVAQQARQVKETYQRASKTLNRLCDHNIHGDPIEEAVRREQQVRQSLGKVPPYYYNDDESDVLEQATKDSIAETHATITAAGPEVDRLLAQVQAWERQHTEAARQVNDLRQLMGNLDQALDSGPQGLNLEPFEARFNQLKVIADNLFATLSRLEIDSLEAVTKEAARVFQSAQEMETQVKQARQKLGELEQLLPELSAGLKHLSNQFSALGMHSTHPIAWEQSRATLTSLSRQSAGIGPANKPRTPEQIVQDLETANRINTQRQELTRRFQVIEQQHEELIRLLESPQLSQGTEWRRKSVKMLERVGEYDPENWPRADSVTNLSGEMHSLREGLQDLVDGDHTEPIGETEMEERLEATRRLEQFAGGLRERMEKIQARLSEVQQNEQRARDQLDAAGSALSQVALLVRSNGLLAEVAGGEITRLQANVQQLRQELDQRKRGSVEKKARAVEALTLRIEQTANGWLDELTKDMQAYKRALSELLAEVEGIATLEEAAVDEARRLLAAGQSFETTGTAGKNNFRLNEIVMEMKRRSDYWQASAAAYRALEDVVRPVIDAYAAAMHAREEARGQFDDIVVWMRNTRTWPPTSLNLDPEQQDLAKLEEQWKVLKQQEARAISFVGQFSGLMGRYQSVVEKTAHKAERIAAEKQAIERIEAELDELQQLWQNQWQNHRDNPLVSNEIRKLLGEIDKERNQIKKQYRAGSMPYSQVLQSLQQLQRQARTTQVNYDDEHVIDVNGQVIGFQR